MTNGLLQVERGGGVRVFERVDGGRNLKLVAENSSIEAPTGFLWV